MLLLDYQARQPSGDCLQQQLSLLLHHHCPLDLHVCLLLLPYDFFLLPHSQDGVLLVSGRRIW